MTLVYPRQIAGERLAEDRTGFEATIRHLVDMEAINVDNICSAIGTGYALGDAHPCVPSIECVDIAATPLPTDPSKFQVDYTFRAPELEATAAGEFSMSGSLTDQQTTRDRDGNQAELTYTYPATYKDPVLAGQTRSQYADLEYAAPTLLLRWQRLNTFAAAWANRAVLGTVNSLLFQGFDPGTLFCTRMEIERANETYREIFEFQSGSPDTWKAYTIFRQEDDNRPVPNPDALAEKLIDVYPEYNFNLLGLALPS